MDQMPRSGEFYRHFKGNNYQVITIAEQEKTGEKLVIYQALYGEFTVYARPLTEFVEELDPKMYPGAGQRLRFERFDPKEAAGGRRQADGEDVRKPEMIGEDAEREAGERDEKSGEDAKTENPERDAESGADEDRGGGKKPNPWLMKFLDAESNEDKYNVLMAMRDEVTDRLIDDFAVVMDVVIPEGDLLRRYDELKYVVRTRQKYEITNRLK